MRTEAPEQSKARILEQVRKIMEVASTANGAGQEEIENAINIARRLMAKHNIHEDELLVAQVSASAANSQPSVKVAEQEAFSRAGSLDRHDIVMASIDVLFDCRHYTDKYYKDGARQRIVFYGLPQDLPTCTLLYQELLTIKRAMARVRYGSKPSWSALHTAYAVGFSEGLASRACQMKDQEKADASSPEKATQNGLSIHTTAIVLRKAELLTNHATQIGLVSAKRRPVQYNANAYARGREDAQNVNLTPHKLENK